MTYQIRNYLLFPLFAIAICLFSSCSEEPEAPIENERLILIYAVAANNLEPYLNYDMKEIIQVADSSKLNLRNNKVLIYTVNQQNECELLELYKNSKTGKHEYKTLVKFPSLPLSTSEERISEVISYVTDNFDYPRKGLILWSHATGWIPWFQGSTPEMAGNRRAWGHDNYDKNTYKTNINALAEAIPSNVFDFIWFDCCYMANIETVYELESKTDYVVGSVLEIASNGMPYDKTMPFLLRKDPDLKGAAFEFFKYYDIRSTAVSISIMDMKYLSELAYASRDLFTYGKAPSTLSSIQTYQRNMDVKFYDMGQLMLSYTGKEDEENFEYNLSAYKDSFREAMNKVVIYKKISDFDFNFRPINTEAYSGLSMHNFTNNGSGEDEFYQELNWYNATR